MVQIEEVLEIVLSRRMIEQLYEGISEQLKAHSEDTPEKLRAALDILTINYKDLRLKKNKEDYYEIDLLPEDYLKLREHITTATEAALLKHRRALLQLRDGNVADGQWFQVAEGIEFGRSGRAPRLGFASPKYLVSFEDNGMIAVKDKNNGYSTVSWANRESILQDFCQKMNLLPNAVPIEEDESPAEGQLSNAAINVPVSALEGVIAGENARIKKIIHDLIQHIELHQNGRSKILSNTAGKTNKLRAIAAFLDVRREDIGGEEKATVFALIHNVCKIKRNPLSYFFETAESHSVEEFMGTLTPGEQSSMEGISFSARELNQLIPTRPDAVSGLIQLKKDAPTSGRLYGGAVAG